MSERQRAQIKAEPVTSRQKWRARLAITGDAYKQPNTTAHLHKFYINEYSTPAAEVKKELFRGIEKLNAKWNGGDKTCGGFPYLTQQECRFKNEEMKQFCSGELKPEAVVRGFCLS